MEINLESVEPNINLEIFKELLSNKAYFIYELVQNADDSKSTHLGLRLYENELFVWNDGNPFSQQDVQNICSTGSSDKDLTQIGNFGIGFKSVYGYTDFPEIYSNGVCFRIPYLKKPEAIDMDPRIVELIDENATVVFRLPFKEGLPPEDITNLKDQLFNLEKRRSLLFLPYLKTIQWYDEKNRQTGSYSCHSPDKSRNPALVKLKSSMNGENQFSERFLVFRKEAKPQKNVVGKFQHQAKNRVQRSGEELQPIEVAFKLQDGKITTMDSCVLFAYLPTEIKTDLRFLIQARYQTTPPRDNILNPAESPWNKWLVQETASFCPKVLEQLKENRLLEPTFFNVIPLKTDPVRTEFALIAEALKEAIRTSPLIPTEKDGHYARARDVFYPDTTNLRKLVKSSGILPDSSLLHPDIQNNEKFRQCFKVMREVGVKEINESHMLRWLEEQSCDWFKNRTNKWLRSLYVYFNRKWSESEWERIKKLPLVRLENGEHVCVSDQLVFFPPDTDEDLEEIKPFLNDLSILQSVLLEGEDHNDVKAFLGEENLGVEVLHPENLINESICPLYNQPNKPSIMRNRRHVRYIFKSWRGVEGFERSRLEESVSEIPILRAYKGIQREVSDFVVPCNAYLQRAYTGDNDLETYFSISDGNLWFVDDKYLTNKSDTKAWLRFLKAIGAMDTPRVIKRNIPVDYKACNDRSIQRSTITRTGEETIEDHSLYGLSVVLSEINEHRNVKLSQVLWSLLVKALPLTEQERETFFKETYKGTYRSKYRSNSYTDSDHFDAVFYRRLKLVAWIPDEQGNLHFPNKCFMPTSENQEILGDSVTYVHSDFDMNTRPAQWLAKKLGIRLKADEDDVLKYLQTLSQRKSSIEIEKVEPLYRFLYDNRPCERVESIFPKYSYMKDSVPPWRQRFEKEPLIFIPKPKPHWRSTHEVFWKDEGLAFGNDCGYLEAHYREHLESFFTNSLAVPEHAGTLDYIQGIQNIVSMERTELASRKRVEILYCYLWQSLQEDDDWQESEEWKQVREESYWLGKKKNEWGFFSPQELVWKDDEYRSELFQNKVPFWTFGGDLLELAKELGVKGCYQDSGVKFDYCGNQEEDTDWSVKVRNLYQNIHNFLHSPLLCGEHEEEKSTQVLSRLSVRQVEELEVRFRLKGVSVLDPHPCQSFLEETDQEATLWLASEASESQYAWLIGDALQDYFGNVKELSGFVEDLLTKNEKIVLNRWKQKGLQTKTDDSTEREENRTALVDDKFPNESDSTDADTAVGESNISIPTDDEDSDFGSGEVGASEAHFSNNEDNDSAMDEFEVETPIDGAISEIGDSDSNSTSDIKDMSSSDTQAPTKNESVTTQPTDGKSEREIPTINESPGVGSRNINSGTDNSEIHTPASTTQKWRG